MKTKELPIPSFFDTTLADRVWRVPYQQRADEAAQWRKTHHIKPSSQDEQSVCLLLVDVQNTFCVPDFELYVGGTDGHAAVKDSQRLVSFIYRNIPCITHVCATMDTHQTMQIFHNIFLVNQYGDHPEPYTLITPNDIEKGVWRFNEQLSESFHIKEGYGQSYLSHYAKGLRKGGKYDLTVWPYHAMLGGIGHALVSVVEEAVFFHGVCRFDQPDFQSKGDHPFTENYSVLRPEITKGLDNKEFVSKNKELIDKLLTFDAVIIAGQAKSHCVAWTIEDLLVEINQKDPAQVSKIYLLEDCTSPVVIPGVIDYSDQANEAFQRFEDAGMHIVQSTDSITEWPDFPA